MRPTTASEAFLFSCSDYADADCALDLRCDCMHSTIYSFRGLVGDRPDLAGATIDKVLPKLRCRRTCRKPPKRIALVDFSNGSKGLYDRNKPWMLVLLERAGTG